MSSRSLYATRLRRAFLLRVHPDRFRRADIQTQQSTLVKALSNRMNQVDFTVWLQQLPPQHARTNHDGQDSTTTTTLTRTTNTYPYVVEKRDGSLLKLSLPLGGSVEEILNAMAHALVQSGAASIPALLETPSSSREDPRSPSNEPSSRNDATFQNFQSKARGNASRCYDVPSMRGRDLRHYLRRRQEDNSGGDTAGRWARPPPLIETIRERRAARTDAQAVALQIRKVYQFAAVDATETQWLSSSVAVLLRRFLSLHDEFAHRLNVTSFYPIRLVFSPREISICGEDRTAALDVYGGVLRLHPASTSLQWLERLQVVTPERLRTMQRHRDGLHSRTAAIQRALNIRLQKGFTCSSRDYHCFVERLAAPLMDVATLRVNGGDDESSYSSSGVPMSAFSSTSLSQLLPSTTSMVKHPPPSFVMETKNEVVQVVVEAESLCRRAVVTTEGCLRLGAAMSVEQCHDALRQYGSVAQKRFVVNQAVQNRCTAAIVALQSHVVGLHKVYRTTVNGGGGGGRAVSHEEFLDCLSRLLEVARAPNPPDYSFLQDLCQTLAGNSLGIAATGHTCHVADDGSIVIPHDWT